MSVLSNVESLKLRASYSTVVEEVNIRDVSLDVATPRSPGPEAQIAAIVEKCECPPQATGTSCQVRLRSGGESN